MYTNISEYKNKLYVTEVNEENNNLITSYHVIDDFKPELYVETYNESKYKGYPYFNNLEKIEFESIKEFKEYLFKMKDVSTDFYGNISAEYQYINKYYNKTDIVKTRTHKMDIETNVEDEFPDPVKAEQPITFIQVYDNFTNDINIFLWQMEYTRQLPNDVTIHKYDDEKEMLDAWLKFYYERKPHICTGWNFVGFDTRYLTNRLKKLGYAKGILSPFGKTETKKYVIFNEDVEVEYPIGIVWIDYADVFDKHAYIKTPDKKLDTVSQTVLGEGEGKLDWKEYFKSFKDMAHQVYTPPRNPSEEHKETLIYKLYQARKSLDKDDSEYEIKYNKLTKAMKQECFNIFTDYSILDVRILKDIDRKIQMMSLITTYAWTMGINIPDVLGTVKPWTCKLYGTLLEDNIVIPSKINDHIFYKPVGGYWDSNPGLYNNILSHDFTSLYPLSAVTLNMSPDTIVLDKDIPKDLLSLVEPLRKYYDGKNWIDRDDNMKIYLSFTDEHKEAIRLLCEKYNYTFATNGTFYRKDTKGYLPIIIENIFAKRKEYKKLMKESDNDNDKVKYDIMQMTQKILINSLYGALGNRHFPIGVSDIAAAITAYGRCSLLTLNESGNKVNRKIANKDIVVSNFATDCCYFVMDDIVNVAFKGKEPELSIKTKFLVDLNEKVLTPQINKDIDELFYLHNGYINRMSTVNEVIAKGLVTGISKYSLRVYAAEGNILDKPKSKTTGMPQINMTIPKPVRNALNNIVDIIFDKDNHALTKYIDEYKQEFNNYKPSDISLKMGVSSLKKYEGMTKGIFWASKASLIYNDILISNKLDQEFDLIEEGDKINIIYLNKNPITRAETLAFKDDEFLVRMGLDKYIDRDKHFNNLFLEAVKTFCETINWNTNANSLLLDDLF